MAYDNELKAVNSAECLRISLLLCKKATEEEFKSQDKKQGYDYVDSSKIHYTANFAGERDYDSGETLGFAKERSVIRESLKKANWSIKTICSLVRQRIS